MHAHGPLRRHGWGARVAGGVPAATLQLHRQLKAAKHYDRGLSLGGKTGDWVQVATRGNSSYIPRIRSELLCDIERAIEPRIHFMMPMTADGTVVLDAEDIGKSMDRPSVREGSLCSS